MGLFDSPAHLLILLVVVLLLFGAKRLPGSARSLGQAMRIFKAETREARKEQEPADEPAAQLPAGAAADPGAQPAEAQRTSQSGPPAAG